MEDDPRVVKQPHNGKSLKSQLTYLQQLLYSPALRCRIAQASQACDHDNASTAEAANINP
jgi:hypothetical protein